MSLLQQELRCTAARSSIRQAEIKETRMRRSLLLLVADVWNRWLEKRRETELKRIQAQLTQAQWKNSLAQRTHEADLAAGYNLGHFNTMQ